MLQALNCDEGETPGLGDKLVTRPLSSTVGLRTIILTNQSWPSHSVHGYSSLVAAGKDGVLDCRKKFVNFSLPAEDPEGSASVAAEARMSHSRPRCAVDDGFVWSEREADMDRR